MVLLLDKLVLGIYPDLSTVFSVSVLWVDFNLYIDLTLSVLLLLGAYTVLLDAFDLSYLLLCQSSFLMKWEEWWLTSPH